jgi:peroxiredoxin Q/BCP
MTHLKPGDIAPGFSFENQEGKISSLENFKGKKLILYFYPKDNTSGCTAEACNLRDNFQILRDKDFEIIGVSPDNEKSHLNFISKHELPFELISDIDHKILKDYGVWGEKKMFGKVKEGVFRTTFVIDETGKIEKVFKKVQTKDHAQQILNEY